MADTPVWDEEAHELRVMKDKCSTCIFGNRLNGNISAARVREMVETARQTEMGNITCHHTLSYSFPPQKVGAICKGWWDLDGKRTWWGRLAVLENIIRWWSEPNNELQGVQKCSE